MVSQYNLWQKVLMAHFLNDEEGATAIEYALIAALISVVILLALSTVGDKMVNMYTNTISAALP